MFWFRSDENGNCLFSAFSVVMGGGNRYVDNLRILVSIELYVNSEFYAKHSSFLCKWWIVILVYLVMLTLLALSVSHGVLDYGKTEKELTKEKALNICRSFRPCSQNSLVWVIPKGFWSVSQSVGQSVSRLEIFSTLEGNFFYFIEFIYRTYKMIYTSYGIHQELWILEI